MDNATELATSPSEMRLAAVDLLKQADDLEETILRNAGRRVMRIRYGCSRSESGKYWLGLQKNKKRGELRHFATVENGYSYCEEEMRPGERWEDDEFSHEIFGLFELISESRDEHGNILGLFAECQTKR